MLPAAERKVDIAEFRSKLAELAPVFEGGSFRHEVDQKSGRYLDQAEVAPTTALCLQRLRDEGAITLTTESDAPVNILTFGESTRVSHIARLQQASRQ